MRSDALQQREEKKEEEEIKKGQLRNTDRDEFEEMLRSAAMDRESVKSAMGFCLDHCDAAEEVRMLCVWGSCWPCIW